MKATSLSRSSDPSPHTAAGAVEVTGTAMAFSGDGSGLTNIPDFQTFNPGNRS